MTKKICSGKTRPRQNIFLPLLVLLFLSVPLFSQAADSQTDTFTGKVVGVSEGDTISVMRGGRAVKVRLHGIDCPEKKQPFGTKAKWVTSDLAFGREVTVQVKTMDRYGRIVGEVILPDGLSLNKDLVHAGLAWWYHNFAPNDQTLKTLEAEARTAKRGLWADKHPTPPWVWRKRRFKRYGKTPGWNKSREDWITYEFGEEGWFYYEKGQKFRCIPKDELKHIPKNGIWKSFPGGKVCWCIPIETTCFISIELVGGSGNLYIGEKHGLVSVAVFTDEHLWNHWKTYYFKRNDFYERLLEVPVYSWIVVFFDEAMTRSLSGKKILGAKIIDGLSDGDSYAPKSPIQIACNQGKTIVVPIAPFGDDYLWEVAIPIEPTEPTTGGNIILPDMLPTEPTDKPPQGEGNEF